MRVACGVVLVVLGACGKKPCAEIEEACAALAEGGDVEAQDCNALAVSDDKAVCEGELDRCVDYCSTFVAED